MNSVHTAIMQTAEPLLEEEIAAEREENGRETVGSFTRNVEQRVEKKIDALQMETGDDVRVLMGSEMSRVRGWGASKRALLTESYEIDDTAKEGAAAWFEPGSGKTVFDDSVMDIDADAGYWARTRKHEEQHHSEAPTFNCSVITAQGKTYAARPVFTEGRATQHQPDSDLVPSYIHYRNVFRELASHLGSRAPIDAAIESGDIAGLQDKINAKDDSHPQGSKTPPVSGRLL